MVLEKTNPEKKVTSKKAAYSKEQYLSWYNLMLRIRRFEERALLAYSQQKIRGFLHVYIGQEAITAGMESVLRREDGIVTGYRQHGTAIGRGVSTKAAMAELYGKATGVNKGKGGSMHFMSSEHKYFGGNGIVGAQIPIGAGIALAEKYKGTDNLCVTMFGDGAARQGSLHETFNMAMTWKLPVLFICENNNYAMGTSVERTSNVQDLHTLGLGYHMPSEQVDGMQPETVHEAISKAVAHIRSGQGPYFLEIRTYRYKGHSVSDPGSYRSREELKTYMDIDPLKMTVQKILDYGLATETELDEIKERVKAEIEEAVEFAEASPFPDASELYTDNYAEPNYPFMRD
ncbi:MAG: pyruvate dehydrogenase (acetyl-transferring) E1 component subunit alpha [Bacteroidetes bacterium]|nr:pyruvate dehydrogenase (acetyl-transferring) E1 component subunit alpha [Bacteroidota bacterium]